LRDLEIEIKVALMTGYSRKPCQRMYDNIKPFQVQKLWDFVKLVLEVDIIGYS